MEEWKEESTVNFEGLFRVLARPKDFLPEKLFDRYVNTLKQFPEPWMNRAQLERIQENRDAVYFGKEPWYVIEKAPSWVKTFPRATNKEGTGTHMAERPTAPTFDDDRLVYRAIARTIVPEMCLFLDAHWPKAQPKLQIQSKDFHLHTITYYIKAPRIEVQGRQYALLLILSPTFDQLRVHCLLHQGQQPTQSLNLHVYAPGTQLDAADIEPLATVLCLDIPDCQDPSLAGIACIQVKPDHCQLLPRVTQDDFNPDEYFADTYMKARQPTMSKTQWRVASHVLQDTPESGN